jgi:hypothetical protein
MADIIQYFLTVGPLQAVGVAGFFVYIAAFASVQFGWLDGNSASYAAGNVLAAVLVAISLFAEFNLSSALIQASWIVIGLVGLARHVMRHAANRTQPVSNNILKETI